MSKFFDHRLKNSQGFSIVQVIISMGLLTGLIVAGFKMIESQTRVGKSSSFYFESLHMVDEIKTILSQKKACALTLENKSAYFESIQNIFSADSNSNGEVEYRVQKEGKPLYGQMNLLIEKMELNGNSPQLGTDQGLTILKIFFTEQGMNPERFSFEIPIHVQVNEMGRIESCFTLAGIDGGASSSANSMAWRKKAQDQNIEEKVLRANGSQVMIGSDKKISSAALAIEGGIKVGHSGQCDENSIGLLSYSSKDGRYSWCNEEGSWESLDKKSALISEYQDFSVAHNNREVKTIITQENFRFCEVQEFNFEAGVCWVRPIKADTLMGRWELISQYLRGDQVKCSFRCFR